MADGDRVGSVAAERNGVENVDAASGDGARISGVERVSEEERDYDLTIRIVNGHPAVSSRYESDAAVHVHPWATSRHLEAVSPRHSDRACRRRADPHICFHHRTSAGDLLGRRILGDNSLARHVLDDGRPHENRATHRDTSRHAVGRNPAHSDATHRTRTAVDRHNDLPSNHHPWSLAHLFPSAHPCPPCQ